MPRGERRKLAEYFVKTRLFTFVRHIEPMHITPDNRLKKLIVIGDRLLIKPTRPDERTASGLYLPPGVQEKEKVQQGYVIKTGPGYAIPMPIEEESWKSEDEKIKAIAEVKGMAVKTAEVFVNKISDFKEFLMKCGLEDKLYEKTDTQVNQCSCLR